MEEREREKEREREREGELEVRDEEKTERERWREEEGEEREGWRGRDGERGADGPGNRSVALSRAQGAQAGLSAPLISQSHVTLITESPDSVFLSPAPP